MLCDCSTQKQLPCSRRQLGSQHFRVCSKRLVDVTAVTCTPVYDGSAEGLLSKSLHSSQHSSLRPLPHAAILPDHTHRAPIIHRSIDWVGSQARFDDGLRPAVERVCAAARCETNAARILLLTVGGVSPRVSDGLARMGVVRLPLSLPLSYRCPGIALDASSFMATALLVALGSPATAYAATPPLPLPPPLCLPTRPPPPPHYDCRVQAPGGLPGAPHRGRQLRRRPCRRHLPPGGDERGAGSRPHARGRWAARILAVLPDCLLLG